MGCDDEAHGGGRWGAVRLAVSGAVCALARDSKSAGTIKVEVRLDGEGAPSPSVFCSTAPQELTRCIAESFRAMRFPKPDASTPAVFTVPIVLAVKGP